MSQDQQQHRRGNQRRDPDFSAARGCVWGPGLAVLLFVMIIAGVLVGLYRWTHYLVPPPPPPGSSAAPPGPGGIPTR